MLDQVLKEHYTAYNNELLRVKAEWVDANLASNTERDYYYIRLISYLEGAKEAIWSVAEKTVGEIETERWLGEHD